MAFDCDWSSATEILRNVSLAASAPFAAWVGWQGLNVFKRETTWGKNSELAEEMLVLLYKRRDAVSNVRNPLVRYEPVYTPNEDGNIPDHEQARFHGYSKEYERRWQNLLDIRSEMYGKRLRADAIWGTALSELLQKITTLEQRLYVNLRRHLDAMNPDMNPSRRDAAAAHVDDELLYETGEENEFENDYRTGFLEAETFLRGKLESNK